MARRIVLGVDSSTQSTKVEARDLDSGELVGFGSGRHPATTPPISEQDPTAWWDALVDATFQLGDDVRAGVVAIAVAGQQHGLVLLDEAGEPVRPAKLWNDTTSAPQAARLVATLGADHWANTVGSVPVPAFTISKLAWVAEHEPALLARATRVMLPHDYLTWRLTGEHVTDRGDASGTGWFDPSTGDVRSDLIATAAPGWQGSTPRVLGTTEAAGPIDPTVALMLGLPDGVVVGPGTGDNMAAAIGLGLRPGDIAISLGTSGTVFAVSPTPTRDPTGAVAGFASATGEFLPLVCTLNATKVTDTVASWFGHSADGLGEMALRAADHPGGVVLLPYLDGERTPNLPDATGNLGGLRTTTTAAQIALAAHDGVICGLLDGLDALHAAGAVLDGELMLVGGGSRSVAYRQRTADLSGRSVRIPDQTEVVATGAAAQAAAVISDAAIGEVITAWKLGSGTSVEPARDASAVRRSYGEASARYDDAPET